MRKMQGFIYRS